MSDFDFDILGINYRGEPYNHKDSPYYKFRNLTIYPASNEGDILGREKLFRLLEQGNYDTLFIIQDIFNIYSILPRLRELRLKKRFKIVFYFPIDGKPKEKWLEVLDFVDQPISYTNWSNTQLKRPNPVIYHGVEKLFKRLPLKDVKAFRKSYFGVGNDTTIITNVNRNQPRKDLLKTILAFNLFQTYNPKSILYLHCNPKDGAGVDLQELIRHNFPHLTKKILFPTSILTREQLNQVYNASDMVVSTTLGEGFGLSTIEAMVTETPVILPNNTTASELLGNGKRGFLVASGNNWSNFMVQNNDNEIIRPTVDVNDLVKQMLRVSDKKNKSKVKKITKEASKWVRENCDWDKIALQWKEYL
jgi:D-inositol-3-phosphate glycosyltransferase